MLTDSLRARLTVWYTCVLALVLVSFAAVSYAAMAGLGSAAEDESLRHAAEALSSAIREEASHEEIERTTSSPPGERWADEAVADVVSAFRYGEDRFYVFGESATPLAASLGAETDPPGEMAAHGRPTDGFETVSDGNWRVYVEHVSTSAGPFTIVATHSLESLTARLAQARRAYAIAVPVALILAAMGGSVLARKSLGPVVAMSEQAERMEASSLNERLVVPNDRDEVGRLARVFNALLARLETSFERQRRFMADASHELRTPVAIVRGEAEVALSRDDRSLAEYRESLGIIHDEGRRLAAIVEDLFTLARADAGERPLVRSEFYLDEAVNEAVRSVRSLAEARGMSVVCEGREELQFNGDEALVNRLVLNLLDNAIKYTRPDGEVRVDLEREGQAYVLEVSDTGIGIPPEAQAHVFDRFFRAEKARSSENADDASGGAGLGLSIAHWIAEAHGGRIELVRSSEHGTTFAVTLPIAGGAVDETYPRNGEHHGTSS